MTTSPGLVERRLAPLDVPFDRPSGVTFGALTFTRPDPSQLGGVRSWWLNTDQLGPVTTGWGRDRATGSTAPSNLSTSFYWRDAVDAAGTVPGADTVPEIGDQVSFSIASDATGDYFGVGDVFSVSDSGFGNRFGGYVSDLSVDPVTGLVQLVAVGAKAKLGQIVVGAVPWPQETDIQRAWRILEAARIASGDEISNGVNVAVTSDVIVLARDVDAQNAQALLEDLEQTAGGLFLENRAGAGVVNTIRYRDAGARETDDPLLELTADQLLAGPPRWVKNKDGLVNDLTVTYGVDGASSVRVVDDLSVDAVGPYPVKIDTRLATAAAARSMATQLVGRYGRPRWAMQQIAVDVLRTVDPATAWLLMQVDTGSLLTLTGLPTNGPGGSTVRVFVEGGSETITRDSWRMALNVSDYELSAPGLAWQDVPAGITWADLPAGVSWLGSSSYRPENTGPPRWVDLPARRSWSDLAQSGDHRTWTTYDPNSEE